MPDPNALFSGVTSKRFTSFGADIDLRTAVPTGGTKTNAACRRITINAGSGVAVAVQYADGSSDTWPGLNAGDQRDIQAVKILASGTTATDVTVSW